MAAIIQSLKITKNIISKHPYPILTFARNHWNKDNKPGLYPKTEAERAAAAKRYQLLPEEYQPYADDGLGYGDYPKLPDVGAEMRDEYYPYDFPELKRNLNEPLHAEFDMYTDSRYSQPAPLRYPMYVYVGTFVGVIAVFVGLYIFLEDKKMFRPAKPKQFASENEVHYTFEPAT